MSISLEQFTTSSLDLTRVPFITPSLQITEQTLHSLQSVPLRVQGGLVVAVVVAVVVVVVVVVVVDAVAASVVVVVVVVAPS